MRIPADEPRKIADGPGPPRTGSTLADPSDPRLDDFRDLIDTRFRHRLERERCLAIAEGFPLVERLLRQEVRLRTLVTTPQAYGRVQALDGDPDRVMVATRETISEVVGFEFRRSVIASFQRPPVTTLAEVLGHATRIVMIEGVNDAENLGAIFRAAAAFGIDAVIVDRTTIDPFYRRCIRVSMGAGLIVPHAVVDSVPDALSQVHTKGYSSVAMTTNPGARRLADWSPPSRVAILVGAEGRGLRPGTIALATDEVTIPTTDAVDSLNIAHAAAIAFYHMSVH